MNDSLRKGNLDPGLAERLVGRSIQPVDADAPLTGLVDPALNAKDQRRVTHLDEANARRGIVQDEVDRLRCLHEHLTDLIEDT